MKITEFSSVMIACRLFLLGAEGYINDYMNIIPAWLIAIHRIN
jgi:hypothetical protein